MTCAYNANLSLNICIVCFPLTLYLEVRFCLGMSVGCMQVRRRRRKRHKIQYTVGQHLHPIGIMVRLAITYDSESHLVLLHGNMMEGRYIQEIMKPVLVSYLGTLKEGST